MSVFRFRMQSILDMKAKLEEQAKIEFAQAQQKLTEEQELLEQIIRRKEDYIQQGIRLRNENIDVQEILDNKNAIEYTENLEKEQRLAVNVAQKALDAATRRMMDARAQTRTYEKLKEHAFEEFLKEMEAADQQEINELVTFRFGKAREREE